MVKNLIAKSDGTKLFDHLIQTAEFSLETAKRVINEKHEYYDEILKIAYYNGLLHDIGKSHPEFQKYLKNSEKYKRPFIHSHLSALIVKDLFKIHTPKIGGSEKIITKTILHHHPVNDRSIIDEMHSDTVELIEKLIEYTTIEHPDFINNNLFVQHEDYEFKPFTFNEDTNTIEYFTNEQNEENALFTLFSAILRYSDIFVSNQKLNKNSFLKLSVNGDFEFVKPEHYDARFYAQLKNAEEASNKKFCQYEAPTGFGKTLFGIMYAIKSGKKCYWVDPRNEITKSDYYSIVEEFKTLKLPYSVAYMSGGIYQDCYNCNIEDLTNNPPDITVINIDSFVRPLFKTDSNIRISSFFDSTVIFNEYQEYDTKDAILALFEILKTIRKDFLKNTNTLFLSATKNENLVRNKDVDVLKPENTETFYNKKYYIKYEDTLDINTFKPLNGSDSVIFCNSIKAAQEFKRIGLVDVCIHSQYLDNDRKYNYEKIVKYHSKHAKVNERNLSVSSTSVIGTGCDLTFNNAYFILPTPFYFLQQMGRINRFNDYNNTSVVTIYKNIVTNLKKSEESIVNKIYFTKQLETKFLSYIQKHLPEGEHTLGEIYNVVYNFLEVDSKQEYKTLFKEHRNSAYNHLSTLDYAYTNKKNDENDSSVNLSNKNNIREINPDNIFLQINNDMPEPIQVSREYMDEDLRELFMNNKQQLLKIIRDNKNYFSNKQSFTSFSKHNTTKQYERLIEKSKCSDTPFILLSGRYSYNKDLGLIKNS